MNNSKIIFRSGNLFPFQFLYFAVLLMIFSLLLLISYPYYSPLPLILALIIFTGSFGLELKTEKKEYRIYNSFLFVKRGQWKNYNSIEKIYITSSISKQKVYTRVTGGPTIRKENFNAYLKFDEGETVLLRSYKNKKSLMNGLKKLSEKLGLEITDHSA